MAGIKGRSGGNRPGAGRKKEPSTQLRDAIGEVNLPKIVRNLEKWSEGREVVCPHCQERTGIYVPDTVALQSALELMNRRLGKVPQQVQVDITETIQLSGDQCDALIERFKFAQRALLPEGDIIEGEYKEA